MNIKDIIFELANAYVEHYKKEYRIYKALEAEEIYVDTVDNPYTSAIEKIFQNITGGIDFASALCEFAANGGGIAGSNPALAHLSDNRRKRR